MDKFLQIVYEGQFDGTGKRDKTFEFFKPTFDMLKGILSEELYEKVEEQFIADASQNNSFFAVEAMKLAIGIMDGTYVPYI